MGTEVPIVVTLDLHANISPDLIEFADVIIGFDTYPILIWAIEGMKRFP